MPILAYFKVTARWFVFPRSDPRKSIIAGANHALLSAKLHVDITMTSKWARWRRKSPASPLFTQPFIRAQIKEIIKAPRHWPFGEFPHKWPVMRKMFPIDDVIMERTLKDLRSNLGMKREAHSVHYGNQSRGYLIGGRPLWPPAEPRLAARSSQSNPRGSGPEVLKRERGHVTAETGVAQVGVFRALQPNDFNHRWQTHPTNTTMH